jgi:hypothetical protein
MRVRVKASLKAFGFDGIKRRYPGDEFDFAGDVCPSWAEPVKSEPEPKPRQKPGPKPKQKEEPQAPDSDEGDEA